MSRCVARRPVKDPPHQCKVRRRIVACARDLRLSPGERASEVAHRRVVIGDACKQGDEARPQLARDTCAADTGRAMSSRRVVRKRVPLRQGKYRAFEQRLFARVPWLAAPTLRLVARLPPSSRLRQALMWRGIRLSAEAFNRRDLDALAPTREPEFEFHPPREAVESGFFEGDVAGERALTPAMRVLTCKYPLAYCLGSG